ncbi:MAG: YlbF family regulator [Eubacteriaceae bacterium]|jgi:cell fate (sporulation/competence/biofilm development) regulator YlbF (YheA/YmcA/DUF963 family)|nr:YlbF family regulator [Eubacteriaceae bacterium]
MNIYDKLHELTRAIEQSDEYKRYKRAAEKVDSNDAHSKMLKDFIAAQMQISTSKMLGQEPTQEMISSFNTLYSTISSISDISEFLSAQAVFSVVMEDVSREINKSASVEVKFLEMPDFSGSNI